MREFALPLHEANGPRRDDGNSVAVEVIEELLNITCNRSLIQRLEGAFVVVDDFTSGCEHPVRTCLPPR